MAVSIKLLRIGKKGAPNYRFVIIDKRKKPSSDYIESIGTYNPFAKDSTVSVKDERLEYWVKQGAIISEGVHKLLRSKIHTIKSKVVTQK
jgi:small subunit ribosomal protein S16